MENPMFVDEDAIPTIHQEKNYDDYKTLDKSRIEEETLFTVSDITEATLTLQLRQKVKRDKITALYKHFNVTGNLDLIDLDRFMIKKKKFKNRQH